MEKISTGIEGLDRLTDGGLLRGSAYIVQGPPGAGKTILANQFCYAHVRAGGRALYMTLLAESSARMLNYVRQMAFFEDTAVPEAMQYISAYGVLEREGLPGLLKLVQHELKRHRATVMVLDGTFVAQSVASENEFRAFIHALQGVAGIADAVLMMLTHQNRESSSPEHTMLDGWIELRDETRKFRSYRTIQIRKHRGAEIVRGKHQFRITKMGIAVFPRVESYLDPKPSEEMQAGRLSTGLPALDVLVDGGLPAASATLLLGPTGAGKTIAGLHFLSQATVEAPALMLGFYETPARLRMKARDIGMDLDGLIASGAVELVWRPPLENIVDELAIELIERVRKSGAKRVFVDGLVAVRDNLVDPERLPYMLNALNLHLRELGATTLYTFELPALGLANDTRMPTDQLSAMTDNVVLVSLDQHKSALHRELSVIKLRDSNFDPRVHQFHIDAHGIVFGPDPRALGPAD